MLTPNPNECNSTLSSVTGGIYLHPDTYIYKCSLVVWNPRVDRLQGDTCPYVCPQTGLN